MAEEPRIGGAPAVVLRAEPTTPAGPAFVEATVLPGRGMMLLQARLRLASGQVIDALAAPPLDEAARRLAGGPEDFAGNASFSFGGAILAPFANRIRGEALAQTREIATRIAGQPVRLPRNWGGKRPGAEQYAMHGLILDTPVSWRQDAPDRVSGRLEAGDFAGRWPGRFVFDFEWRLLADGLSLGVTATNVGEAPAPVGLGWHPYFALPSGDRRRARLRLAARARALVNDYDEVLPTGVVEPTAGGAYDFAAGKALGDLYLDDCFTNLVRGADGVLAEIADPAAGLGLRLCSTSPNISAIQVFAPPDRPIVVVEPQFNLADPFGAEWGGRDTGMASVPPGGSAAYAVLVQPFALDQAPTV